MAPSHSPSPFSIRLLLLIPLLSLAFSPSLSLDTPEDETETVAVRMRGRPRSVARMAAMEDAFSSDSFITKRVLRVRHHSPPSPSPPPSSLSRYRQRRHRRRQRAAQRAAEALNHTRPHAADAPAPSPSPNPAPPPVLRENMTAAASSKAALPSFPVSPSSSSDAVGPLAVAGIAAAILTSVTAVGVFAYACRGGGEGGEGTGGDSGKKLRDEGGGSPGGMKGGHAPFHVAELDDASGFTDISLTTPRSPSKEGVGKKQRRGFWGLRWGGGTVVPTVAEEVQENGVDRDPSVPIHMYSYRDLQKATRNFVTQIGNGSCGPVYKAGFSTGLEAVVKVMDKLAATSEQDFQDEVVHLGRLHHPHLVNLLGFCTDRGHKMLIYEYMSNGSLEARLQDQERPTLKWADRVRIIKEVAYGLHYLHDENQPAVLHRDIKASNVLLDSDMSARVADFGLSRSKSDASAKQASLKGSGGYTDPDFLVNGMYSEKSDVYSFGVLVFEVMAGRTPQQGLIEYINLATMGEEGKERWSIIVDPRLEGRYAKDELAVIASIAHKCIRKSPRRRPKISEVVEALSQVGPAGPESHSPASLPINRPIVAKRTPSWDTVTSPLPTTPSRLKASIQSFANFQRVQGGGGMGGEFTALGGVPLPLPPPPVGGREAIEQLKAMFEGRGGYGVSEGEGREGGKRSGNESS